MELENFAVYEATYFESMWDNISSALAVGGRFSGHFFGVNDDWANEFKKGKFPTVHHTLKEVEDIFTDFSIEYFLEQDHEGTVSSGEAKHWHVFHVVAMKK